jgi:hypothetical protein
MLIGLQESFAIEYFVVESSELASVQREYMPVVLRYWINNVAVGDMKISCYLGDLVRDFAQIVHDNNNRHGHELCLMNKKIQFIKIYEGIYDDLQPTALDMPAKYNILPRLPPFGEWFVFAIKCANQSVLLYYEFPFSEIGCHAIYEHQLNGVRRLTFNNMSGILEGLRCFGDANSSELSGMGSFTNEDD